MTSVTFLLPGHGEVPVGGFKIAYEYAGQLAARGHRARVVHPARYDPHLPWSRRPLKWARYLQRRVTGSWRPDPWFRPDPRVELSWVRSLRPRHVPDADVVIATGWHTATWLVDYPRSKGVQLYLVQDYELYQTGTDEVRARMGALFRHPGLTLMAISPAVQGMLAEWGASAHYLPNGIDLTRFRRLVPELPRTHVGFPGRSEAHKGTPEALAALERVRKGRPDLRAWAFGHRPPPGLPAWVEFHARPTPERLCELYNRSAVFLQPSHAEGFGLPGLEAMACGAALISTRCGGVSAYAEDEATALLCPVQDPEALAAALERLLGDPARRAALAEAGHAAAQAFDWPRAADRLEAVIEGALAARRS